MSPPDHSDAFVFFGATGDLAFKQIFPALAGLMRDSGWKLSIIGIVRHGDLASLLLESDDPPLPYRRGTWGPKAAEALLPPGQHWHNPA